MTAQDRAKFATYYRDSTTGLDYAQNRYYASTLGRFTSPDPFKAAGTGLPSDPQRWNQYAYTRNDPVNRYDPLGLQDFPATEGDGEGEDDQAQTDLPGRPSNPSPPKKPTCNVGNSASIARNINFITAYW